MKEPSPAMALVLFLLLLVLAIMGATNLSQCDIPVDIKPGGYVLARQPAAATGDQNSASQSPRRTQDGGAASTVAGR